MNITYYSGVHTHTRLLPVLYTSTFIFIMYHNYVSYYVHLYNIIIFELLLYNTHHYIGIICLYMYIFRQHRYGALFFLTLQDVSSLNRYTYFKKYKTISNAAISQRKITL